MGCLGSELVVRLCVNVSEYASDSHMITTDKITASSVFLEWFIRDDRSCILAYTPKGLTKIIPNLDLSCPK